MKVINRTAWRTDHLKAILQRCAEQEFDDGARRKDLIIVVSYTRGGGSSGYAHIHGRYSTVRIAKPTYAATRYEKASLDDVRPTICWHGQDGVKTAKVVAVRGTPITLDDALLHDLKLRFATVACHEFAHNRGMRHRQMPNYYRWDGNWRRYVAWAADMPLEAVAPKLRLTKTETIDARLTQVQLNLHRAETRFKRARTLLQKWQRKVRYYERKQAALRAETTTDR